MDKVKKMTGNHIIPTPLLALFCVGVTFVVPPGPRGSRSDIHSIPELPAEVEEFSRILFKHGVYVLGCGGGVIPEPRCAIERLRGKYGESDLLEQCLEICMLPKPLPRKLLEGVWRTAHGILFHLGDEATLEKLIAYYPESEEANYNAASNEPAEHCLGSLETLIAGLSMKLVRSLPEGIRPFSDDSWQFIFCPDNYPEH